ncbi:MAG: 30S ribosomal protein S17 [Candidatus Paceibacterota bacterium]|jgi:small subunit ribosomal protein S17|nr:30S ribosomal protein S17 [Candidatus Paceibacterota bacterium]MDD5621069.1 30S ribosomal protein S17 [Candidatus Paceibacterota bacterium]
MAKRRLTGRVVSNKMQKTIVVEVESVKLHQKLQMRYKSHMRYKAHDEKNECNIGDTAVIEECKPISKDKKWRVVERIAQQIKAEE